MIVFAKRRFCLRRCDLRRVFVARAPVDISGISITSDRDLASDVAMAKMGLPERFALLHSELNAFLFAPGGEDSARQWKLICSAIRAIETAVPLPDLMEMSRLTPGQRLDRGVVS